MGLKDALNALLGTTGEAEDTDSDETKTKDEPSQNNDHEVLKRVINKIQNLTENVTSRIDEVTERVEKLEEEDEETQSVDLDPVHKEIDGLKERINSLEETMESFSGVYEAISSQYHPLIEKQEQQNHSEPEQEHVEAKPETPKKTKEGEREITLKDNLTQKSEQFGVKDNPTPTPTTPPGKNNAKHSHELKKAQETPRGNTEQPLQQRPEQPRQDSPTKKEQEQHNHQTKPSKPRPSPHTSQPTHQDTDHTQTTQQNPKPRPQRSHQNHAASNQATEDVIEIGAEPTIQQEQRSEAQHEAQTTKQHAETRPHSQDRNTYQDALFKNMIRKQREHKQHLTTQAPQNEAFHIEGHKPLTDLLDLAETLNEDSDVFNHHVVDQRNIEAWIDGSLRMPDLARRLRGIQDREDYIMTLLAAI
jgi:archaellum component FlaC